MPLLKRTSRLSAARDDRRNPDGLPSDAGSSLQALRTKDFLYLTTVLHDLHFVQVGLELPASGLHGETAVASERSRLSTVVTPGHPTGSLRFSVDVLESGCNGTTGSQVGPTRSTGDFAIVWF